MNVFQWLKRRIAECVVQGFEDGVRALEGGHSDAPSPDLPLALPDALAKRLTQSVGQEKPVETEEAGSNGRRKGKP